MNSTKRKVYFEKQSSDRLCGLHCLNALLQGPFFDAVQLSEIALELDRKESLLLNKGNSVHENVDADGNYNIQVLTQALSIYKSRISPLKASYLINMLGSNRGESIEALIFNSSTHWFAIRKIEGVWYDLNSTNKYPKVISDFYLSAFIQGSEDVGYTNFLVENLMALPDELYYLELQQNQLLFSVEEVHQFKIKEDLSRKERDNKVKKKDEEEQDKGKFKAFNGKGTALDNYDQSNNFFNEEEDDDEVKQAMQMSLSIHMKEIEMMIPVEPSLHDLSAFTIIIRHGDYQFERRFPIETTIGQLKLYVQSQLNTFKQIELSESFPRKIYVEDYLNLKDAGLSKKQILNAKYLS